LANSGTSKVPLDQKEGNQKEKPKAHPLPHKVIQVANSYLNEAKEHQAPRLKVLFKHAPKEKTKG